MTESATPHARLRAKLNEGPRLRHPRMLPRYNASVQARYAVAIGVVLRPAAGSGWLHVHLRAWRVVPDQRSEACANCHVMREQFEGWQRSSHRGVAVCNDCHAPHDLIGKYADQGASTASGTRSTSRPARFTSPSGSRRATPGSPRAPAAPATPTSSTPSTRSRARARRSSCVSCHRNVGHLH